MSSFITFSDDDKAVVWNSTFKTILRELEECSADNPVAARILEDNPIAGPIGGLNLKSLTDNEVVDFVRILSSMRQRAERITSEWTSPQRIAQFPIDIETTIEKANNSS